MYRLVLLTIIVTVRSVPPKPKNLHPYAGLGIVELTMKFGYPLESHHVQTDDGYILTLHRIPHGSHNKTLRKESVLLMHGLFSSSVDWVNMGPGKALALLLADEGYDVWLGNQRGNTWSRKHVTLDPDQDAEKFFDFSFDEIGIYDLPAKIDYILTKTGQEKIFYIGHSQGTTDFFVMGSERPEYNKKIKLMTALAPVAYMGNIPHPFMEQVVQYYDFIQLLIDILDIHEFLPHYQSITDLGNNLCNSDSEYQDSCLSFMNFIGGFDFQIDPNFIPVITTNTPAGASIKQILHFLQEIRSEKFERYDYGTAKNVQKYGQETPPSYNVSKITAPISMYYASNDWLTSVEDVLQLSHQLPNLVNAKKVPLGQFNHLEFLWAQDVVDLLYTDVIAEIKSTQ